MLWPFHYHRPTKPAEVDALLAAHPGATLFAGGTNLVIDMEFDILRPENVIDVKAVEGLDRVDIVADGPSTIGAAVPVNRLYDCKDVSWTCLKDAIGMMATYQVRNRATAVGNLCNASPAADLAPPLLVLGTRVLLRKADGTTRSVALQDFITGVKRTVLGNDEWVTGLEVDAYGAKTKSRFFKKQRVRGHDLAVINVAGCCDPERTRLRVAVGACAVTPLLFVFDDVYAGAKRLDDVVGPVVKKVLETIKPITDVRGSAEYRRDMVEHFTKKLLTDIYC